MTKNDTETWNILRQQYFGKETASQDHEATNQYNSSLREHLVHFPNAEDKGAQKLPENIK
jgi:hypothetical protein